MRKMLLASIIISIMCSLTINVLATTYYIDQENKFGNGSDNRWPGTMEQPWRNFEGTFRTGLEPGDIVIVREATSYSNMVFQGSSSGTEGNPIVVKPYPGEKIIFDGAIIPGGIPGIDFRENASYITIEGPIIISNKEYSITANLYATNKGIKINNCTINNCQQGPRLFTIEDWEITDFTIGPLSVNGFQLRYASNIEIKNVVVHHVDDGKSPDDSDADGFVVHYGSNDIRFINCSTWANAEDGFDLNGDILLDRCRSFDNKGGGIKVFRRPEDSNYAERTVTVVNSLIYNNGYYAPDPGQGNPGVKVSYGAGLNIINSVIFNNHDEGIRVRWASDDFPYQQGMRYLPVYAYNDIIANTMAGIGFVDSYPGGLVTADNNLYYNNNGGDVSGFTIGSNSITGLDPLFIDAANNDFHLNEDSPAINNGTSSGIVKDIIDRFEQLYGINLHMDLDSGLRPYGAEWDIGAYEWGSVPLKGDVNKDGIVNIRDVQCCVNHIQGTQNWGSAADVNGDGIVDEEDVQETINIILGK